MWHWPERTLYPSLIDSAAQPMSEIEPALIHIIARGRSFATWGLGGHSVIIVEYVKDGHRHLISCDIQAELLGSLSDGKITGVQYVERKALLSREDYRLHKTFLPNAPLGVASWRVSFSRAESLLNNIKNDVVETVKALANIFLTLEEKLDDLKIVEYLQPYKKFFHFSECYELSGLNIEDLKNLKSLTDIIDNNPERNEELIAKIQKVDNNYEKITLTMLEAEDLKSFLKNIGKIELSNKIFSKPASRRIMGPEKSWLSLCELVSHQNSYTLEIENFMKICAIKITKKVSWIKDFIKKLYTEKSFNGKIIIDESNLMTYRLTGSGHVLSAWHTSSRANTDDPLNCCEWTQEHLFHKDVGIDIYSRKSTPIGVTANSCRIL